MTCKLRPSLLVLTLLAGCTQPVASSNLPPGWRSNGTANTPQAPAVISAATPTPAGVVATPRPAGSSPEPVKPTAGPSAKPMVAAGQRATEDRPDDGRDFQLHLLYVLPADGRDDQLDTNGAIARSVSAANTWLAGQTDGKRLRLDTYQGAADVTFFRSSKTHVQLGARPDDWHAALTRELQLAGFVHPAKAYAYYYGGGAPNNSPGTHVLGVGGGGYASIMLSQCGDCKPAGEGATAGTIEYTLLHETLHALGFVATCAPHVTEDQHTREDGTDLMFAEQTTESNLQLDPGRDDYFRLDAGTCLNLARSPFLDPRPSSLQPPDDRPLALDPGDKATPFKPALPEVAGDASAEAQLLAALNTARQAAGKPPAVIDPALSRLARQSELLGEGSDYTEVCAGVGYAGASGFKGTNAVGDTSPLDAFKTSPVFAELVAKADLTTLGIGVVPRTGFTNISAAFATARLVLDAVSLGEGPANTYTLAAKVHVPANAKGGLGRAFLDGEGAGGFLMKANEAQTVYVTVPRQGVHEVKLGLEETADGQYGIDLVFHVDGGKAVGSALSLQ